MGDFSWRPLGKQDRISSGTVPPSAIDPPIREGGQPAARADPNDDEVVKVSPDVSFSILAKRKRDDDAGCQVAKSQGLISASKQGGKQ